MNSISPTCNLYRMGSDGTNEELFLYHIPGEFNPLEDSQFRKALANADTVVMKVGREKFKALCGLKDHLTDYAAKRGKTIVCIEDPVCDRAFNLDSLKMSKQFSSVALECLLTNQAEDGKNDRNISEEKSDQYLLMNKTHFIILDPSHDPQRIPTNLFTPHEFKEPKGFFWKLKSPEGHKAYFLGSIHDTPGYLLELNTKIRKKFSKSEVLGVEINGFKEGEKEKYLDETRHAQVKRVRELNLDELEKVDGFAGAYIVKNGLELSEYPTSIYRILIGALILDRRTTTYKTGIDHELIKQADERGIPILDMETRKGFEVSSGTALEVMCSLKDQPDDKTTTPDLVIAEMEKNLYDKRKASIDKFVTWWEEGNFNALKEHRQMVLTQQKDIERMKSRNVEMTERIDKCVQGGKRHFFVAGCGHAPGEFGILKLLEEKGYQITPKY